MPCLGKWSWNYLVVGQQIIMPPPVLQDVTSSAVGIPAPAKPGNPLSVFLIISAKAYSSIGFGLSVLAIWIRWFIPGSQKDVPQPSPVLIKVQATKPPLRRHKKLHSNPQIPQLSRPTPLRRASAPPDSSHLVPIFRQSNEQHTDYTNRRVCFADSPNAPSRRNASPAERSQPLPELEEEVDLENLPPPSATFAPLLTESPPASAIAPVEVSPMLVPTAEVPVVDDTIEQAQSRSNSNSPSSTPRQRKLKLSFTLIPKRSGSDKEPLTPQEPPVKATRKASYPFPWVNSRKLSSESSISIEASTQASPSLVCFQKSASPTTKCSTSSSSVSSLPSMLQRKSQRRVSAPVSRTSPYEAPYFATPPLVSDDSYSQYLRKLPQFDDEFGTISPQSSKDRPSSSSGISHQIQRPVPKRRPASVGREG